MALYQNTRDGQIVEFVSYHDKDYAMVKTATGKVSIVPLETLVSYEPGKGRTGKSIEPQSAEGSLDEELIPTPTIPVDTRLNINTATPETIAKHVRGIGYATAKKIVELRSSLPGERFKELAQLKRVGRVDWDAVIEADLFYIG